ncbi:winged helix-turn-helix transcriptional regulator [Brevibacillus dissolubilis]|uniref:winged helix-turn-helix transcriptional regulator n=1 Tax=Brevibacillus dissolubilis TaxID=1844116 RepID=UPI0011170B8A|nr:helix-turn-helix domain-containing protein [Brevibacillus dissolubilis]
MSKSKSYNLSCNIAKTLDIIGDRWSILIIRDMLMGIHKFSELKHSLEGISSNVLSERLQYFEERGIVRSKQYSAHPPRLEYHLTEKGKQLSTVISAIAIWGNRHLDETYTELVHEACGHEVEMAYFCPHCQEHVTDVITRPHTNTAQP